MARAGGQEQQALQHAQFTGGEAERRTVVQLHHDLEWAMLEALSEAQAASLSSHSAGFKDGARESLLARTPHSPEHTVQ